jgi:hypothetical protein
LTRGIYWYESHFVFKVTTKEINLSAQNIRQFGWCVDSELGGTSQQTKCAQHTDKPETVVTMQMGDEDGTDLGKTQP